MCLASCRLPHIVHIARVRLRGSVQSEAKISAFAGSSTQSGHQHLQSFMMQSQHFSKDGYAAHAIIPRCFLGFMSEKLGMCRASQDILVHVKAAFAFPCTCQVVGVWASLYPASNGCTPLIAHGAPETCTFVSLNKAVSYSYASSKE